MSKRSHFSTAAWNSVHLDISGQIVNTAGGIFIYLRKHCQKLGGRKNEDIHKSWFSDMSVIINRVAVVLHVFQAQTVSKASQLLCVHQLRGTDAAVHPLALCRVICRASPPRLLPSSLFPSPVFCLICRPDIPLQTELYLGSLGISFNILCLSSQRCCSAAPLPSFIPHRAAPPRVHVRSH